MNRWLAIIPLIVLAGLALFSGLKLVSGKPEAPTMEGRTAAARVFAPLREGESFAFNPPPNGKPAIVNLFASWCGPCEVEHPHLEALAETHGDQLFGILYKDSIENGEAFLDRLGDPFRAIALDPDGQGGLHHGITGVPETLVISAEGTVAMHVRGPLTAAEVDAVRDLLEQLN